MDKKDCKVGMKVKFTERISFKNKQERTGTVVGVYSTYAVIKILDKYNSAFFFRDIHEIENKKND